MSRNGTTGPASTPSLTDAVLHAVARGEATSRSELAAHLRVAPSTVSLRVQELVDQGILVEDGEGVSRGGRRPRILRLSRSHGELLVADLGGSHARIGRFDVTGALQHSATVPIQIADGPESTLRRLAEGFRATASSDAAIVGIGLALPGPVDVHSRSVELPSRMPGWQGFGVGDWLEREFGVAAIVDNDANLAALGEHHLQQGATGHSITVKAGTAIGCGIVVDGALYRGATGAAGDVTHTRIQAAAGEPCSCGNIGCLETVASGAGLVRRLKQDGVEVDSTAEVIELARNAHPVATTLVRTAGTHLGEVLSIVANFFNPDALYLTGGMATCEPFIAAVRSSVYEGCHPLITRRLRIEPARSGADAGLHGAAHLLRDQLTFGRAVAPEPAPEAAITPA